MTLALRRHAPSNPPLPTLAAVYPASRYAMWLLLVDSRFAPIRSVESGFAALSDLSLLPNPCCFLLSSTAI